MWFSETQTYLQLLSTVFSSDFIYSATHVPGGVLYKILRLYRPSKHFPQDSQSNTNNICKQIIIVKCDDVIVYESM